MRCFCGDKFLTLERATYVLEPSIVCCSAECLRKAEANCRRKTLDHHQWHFPLIDKGREQGGQFWPLEHYRDHVLEEVKEFDEAETETEKDKEVVDILHAAETLVRKYFQRNGRNFEQVRYAIIAKNRTRGYYGD